MPLPDNNVPWPPRQWAGELAEMRIDDAWYSGDPTKLATVYRDQPAEQSGRRRLWGRDRTPAPGRPDTRLHIPMPADVACTSARLLFAEPPTLTVEDTATQARLDEITDATGLANTLLEAAEVSAALGGVYLSAAWDAEIGPRPLLTAVHHDAAVPEIRFGHLVAVTFWSELERTGSQVLRRLERHERGMISHGLYLGTVDNLGRAVPLTEHPTTAAYVDSLGPSGVIETGIDTVTAAYLPNIGPNRKHRGSPLGRSDFQGVHHLFDALDSVWTSWMRDIRLARARLIVPAGYLRDRGPGNGATFDEDRDIWHALDIPPTETGAGITLSQFAIRVEEHQRSADALVRQIAESAGYSAQTFGLDGGSTAMTATEVDAREHRSMTTRKTKARYTCPPLAGILGTLLQLDRALGFSTVTPERPRVAVGPAVAEDPTSTAQTLSLLAQAQAVSTETKVRILHPEWDRNAVAAEVQRIHAETGLAIADPVPAFVS
ncbi:phage portal protein [Streptomyces sp. NRRL B-24484]|uniref:phage portal protein n=1 Tax=Streptomyces sp. NRRL B-24484 TaxID=1463833 RepID=UPI0004BF0058|nr:phage portal protein [Streptomyces sp. NRRL B-24484]